jgi:hypothetical protein
MAELFFNKINRPITEFNCGNNSIEDSIKNSYFQNLCEISYTFEVTYSKQVVGYFCLKLHTIEPVDLPEEIGDVDLGRPFLFYAVEIKYLAIWKYIQKKGIGTAIIKTIICLLREYNSNIPYRFVYIDALPELVEWYKKLGFSCFDGVLDATSPTIPMFLDLNSCSNAAAIKEYMEL